MSAPKPRDVGSFILCPVERPREILNPECRRAESHTPTPPGYGEFFDWVGRMVSQGARQSKCPSCGLYAVWSQPRKPVS